MRRPRASSDPDLRRSASGLTLVEVILAISIALGLLFAALTFYQQAAKIRDGIRVEVETASAARLLMQRLTTELQGALRDHGLRFGLRGTRDSIEFTTTSVVGAGAWPLEAGGSTRVPQFDLRRVGYRPGERGIERTERRLPAAIWRRGFRSVTREPVTETLRHLAFRYFDGHRWRVDWNADWGLPRGVEVSLAPREPPARQGGPGAQRRDDPAGKEGDSEPEERLPYGGFRRVIALPCAGEVGPMAARRGA